MNALVAVVDDHDSVRASLRALLEAAGFRVKDYASAIAFLDESEMDDIDCLLADVRMPKMSGMELQEELRRRGVGLPIIIVTGHGDVPLAVSAMKAGAFDFLEKPFDDEMLLGCIRRALAARRRSISLADDTKTAVELIELLTERERQVFKHLVLGKSNKAIAIELGISPRTVEVHRARVQEKMKARSLSDLVRMALNAGQFH